MMSELTESELETMTEQMENTDWYAGGVPTIGADVTIEYDSRAGGSFGADGLSTISGELVEVRDDYPTERKQDLAFTIAQPDRGRYVKLTWDPEYTGVTLKSLAGKNPQRLGRVDSVVFGEDVPEDAAAPVRGVVKDAERGDSVIVNGETWGVYRDHDSSLLLTRGEWDPEGEGAGMRKLSVYSGEVQYMVYQGEELELDHHSVRIGQRASEDTADLLPNPFQIDEGQRVTVTLRSYEGGESLTEDVTGVVTDVDALTEEFTVRTDDGRVLHRDTSHRNSVIATEDGERFHSFDVEPADDVETDSEDSEDSDSESEDAGMETDGGREVRADGGEDIPEVVIPGPNSDAERFHKVLSPCSFHLRDSERVPVNNAQARGFTACPSCDPPTYAPNTESEREVRADGGRPLDPVPECPRCGAIQPREQYAIDTREGSEYLTCPDCGEEHEHRELKVETDGGVVPDDPHSEVKERAIGLDVVTMVKTVGERGEYVAVWRSEDAELEQYHTLMDLAGYAALDPYSVLDEDPGGVDGEDVTLDLWERSAMADGGMVSPDPDSDPDAREDSPTSRALDAVYAVVDRFAGQSVTVRPRPGSLGCSIRYSGFIGPSIASELDDHGLETVHRWSERGPDVDERRGIIHVTGFSDGGDADE